MVLDDLEAFYEGIDRNTLATEARAVGFPEEIIQAAIAAYAGPWVITLQGMISRAVYPLKGIIAGCSLATTLIRILMVRVLDDVIKELPTGTNVDVSVDDIGISVEGPPSQPAREIAEARRLIHDAFRDRLGCKFAEEKTAV